jgi:uncharacterized protein
MCLSERLANSKPSSSRLPSYKEACSFLLKSRCSAPVIAHLKAVSDYAVEVARLHNGADLELVRIGALLHDIGRCQTRGIDHGVVGGQILRSYSVDERLVRIAERHVGAGITDDEAQKLGLPPGHYVPESIEEKIVAAVDNLIENTRRISIERAIENFRCRLDEHPSINRIIRLHKEVFMIA